MGRNADRAGCDERGRTVGRGGHRVLEHLGLHQRCRHRAAGLLLPRGSGGQSGLPPAAAADLLRAQAGEHGADGVAPGRAARGGQHDLHGADARKRKLARGGRQLGAGADHRRLAGGFAHQCDLGAVHSGGDADAERAAVADAVETNPESGFRDAEL